MLFCGEEHRAKVVMKGWSDGLGSPMTDRDVIGIYKMM